LSPDTYTNLPNDERILFLPGDYFDYKEKVQQGILNIGFSNSQEYNRYAYCCNNPINKVDADGHNVAAISMSLSTLGGIGIGISMATGVGEAAIGVGLIAIGVYMLADSISDSIMESKVRDSKEGDDTINLTTEEINRLAKDKSLPASERLKYQRAQKYRDQRNKQKRQNKHKSKGKNNGNGSGNTNNGNDENKSDKGQNDGEE
jgi:hypothetical protein